MKRTPTLAQAFAVETPPSVQLFRELMEALNAHREIVRWRADAVIARREGREPAHDVWLSDIALAARAVHDARAAWRAAHGGTP